jgi:zinc transporter ZupT
MAKGGALAQTIDRAIVIALILLVVLLLAPEIFSALGWSGLVLVAAGYLLPGLLELAVRRAAETLHLASLVLAVLGLLLHALLDGAGLAGSELQASLGFATAIVLHRFSEGLMIWLILQPVFGSRVAWLMLVVMAVATVLGFRFSAALLPLAGDSAVSVLQAVIMGAIIHSLVHRGHVHPHHGDGRRHPG